MYSIGFDIGSSSIKAAIIDLSSGNEVAVASHPACEMKIEAPMEGWAEQNPDLWWKSVCIVTNQLLKKTSIKPSAIQSIGIAYQMHGLVLIDKNHNVLRPAIIWCDSRAVEIGKKALSELGQEYCHHNLLNSPGNFTASKLKWVKENEPETFERIHKILLPGDYIALKMTGEVNTTISGLSEGILWDFAKNNIATRLLEYYEIPVELIPEVIDTFGVQGKLTQNASNEIGLHPSTPLTYRAGDQPNNAMSLRVLNPGEIAATGGTSGVVYGVSDKILSDTQSRINAFAHVNHSHSQKRIGQLLCINGAGSQYAWIKKHVSHNNLSYTDMENEINNIPVGSDGLRVLPFGNGAERMLNNAQPGAHFSNVQFNIHTREHFYRAALEGIAFSFVYGIKAMADLGIIPENIKVGNDNLFQSNTFSMTICNLLGCNIEMMKTTGAIGAAKASRIGIGEFSSPEESIESTQSIKIYSPKINSGIYQNAYNNWESTLANIINLSNDTN
jgi:xylulokinase